MAKPRFDLAAQVAKLGADGLLPPLRLTEPQLAFLQQANNHPLRVAELPRKRGFAENARRKMIERLLAAGYVKSYVHGGYEITPAGRAALEGQEKG